MAKPVSVWESLRSIDHRLRRPVILAYILRESSVGGTEVAVLNRLKRKKNGRLDHFWDLPGGGVKEAYLEAMLGLEPRAAQLLLGARRELGEEVGYMPSIQEMFLPPSLPHRPSAHARGYFHLKENYPVIVTPADHSRIVARREAFPDDARRPFIQWVRPSQLRWMINDDKRSLYEQAMRERSRYAA